MGGPDYEVLPSTCVKERPANLCYAGPWWDSSRCPRTQVEWYDTQAGMNRSWAIEALRSSLILYPGEVDHASSCTFWQSPHVAAARDSMYEIIGALWPSHLLGPYPSKKAVEDNLWKVGDINLLELTTEYATRRATTTIKSIAQCRRRSPQPESGPVDQTCLGARCHHAWRPPLDCQFR